MQVSVIQEPYLTMPISALSTDLIIITSVHFNAFIPSIRMSKCLHLYVPEHVLKVTLRGYSEYMALDNYAMLAWPSQRRETEDSRRQLKNTGGLVVTAIPELFVSSEYIENLRTVFWLKHLHLLLKIRQCN